MRRPFNLGIVRSREHLSPWLERLQGQTTLAVDTETTGLNWMVDRVGGLCLAARRSALYVYGNALGPAVQWLADQVKHQRPLVMHNAKYDLHMLRGTFGLTVGYPVDDTMIQSFLLDNRGARAVAPSVHGGHGLKNLAAAFVDPEARRPEDELRDAVLAAGGRRGRRAKEEWKADVLLGPPKLVGTYGAMDAWYTLQLHLQFMERLRHERQPSDEDIRYPSLMSLYETERWLTLALVSMEKVGIRVDLDYLTKWKETLDRKLERSRHRLTHLAGRDVNWNSTPQIRRVLYEDLEIEAKRWTNGGKKQVPQPATDEVALLDMKHPIAAELLRYRDLDKNHGTYAVGLIRAVTSWSDRRIHCNFKQIGARTGRLSCENPNLQQQSREGGSRRGFVPDDGLVFRFADLSQIEMRFAAHFSNDPTLVHGFVHDPDFDTHAATAKKMWGLRGEPLKQQRKFAKIMNFAMLFGAGENKVTSQLVSMLDESEARHAIRSLGYQPQTAEVPHRTLAKLLRSIYFSEFPAVKGAKYRVQEETERRGFTVNAFGRRRYLDDDETYKAFNSVIQGSAADQAKKGLVDMYRELQVRDGSIQIQLMIHDEVVYQSDGDPRVDRRVLELLTDTTSYRVPITANVGGSATNWHEKSDLKISLERRRR